MTNARRTAIALLVALVPALAACAPAPPPESDYFPPVPCWELAGEPREEVGGQPVGVIEPNAGRCDPFETIDVGPDPGTPEDCASHEPVGPCD